MGTSLTGKNISTTYLGLLKTTDNAVIGSTAKRLTDGSGTDSPLYLSTSKLGIGVTPTEALTISSGNIQLSNDNKIQFGTSDVYISGTTSTDNIQLGIQGATKLTLHQTTGLTLAQYGSGSITGTVTQRLGVTSAGQVVEIPIGGGAVDGSGTAGKITKWTDSDTIGNSIMTETTGLISVAGDVSSKTSDGAILNLQTSDTTVTTDSVLGSIQFNAPNEASGGDAILKSAEIEAVALSAFSATNNATKLVFKVGDSEVASEVLSISKALNMASFATPVVINSSSSSAFKIASGTTNDFLNVGHSAGSTYLSRIGDAYGTHTFKQWDGTTTRNILTLDASQNATFEGDVGMGKLTATKSGTAGVFNSGTTNVVASFTSTDGTGVIQLADSGGNVEIGAAGNDFVVQPAGGVAQLTVGSSSSTFAGDVTANVGTFNSDSGGTGLKIIGRSTANAGALRYYQNNGTTQTARIESNDSIFEINSISNLPIQLKTNNSTAITIDGSQNVGIGTTSPSTKLEISGSGAEELLRLSAQSGFMSFYDGSTRTGYIQSDNSNGFFNIGVEDSNAFRIYMGASERMRITSAGNVGLGTDSPSFKLDISNTTFGDQLRLHRSSVASGGFLTLSANDSAGNKQDYAKIGAIVESATSDSEDGALVFQTSLNSVLTERLRIDSSGNVGIATASPSSYNSAGYNLVIAGTGNSGLTIASGTSNDSNILFADGTSGADAYRGILRYNHATDSMQFFTDASERLRIDSSGRLGIGVTPEAWTVFKPLQIGQASAFVGRTSSNQTDVATNFYYDGAEKRITTGYAQRYTQTSDGKHQFWTAGTDSADSTITFSQKFEIANNGNATFAGNVGIGSSTTGTPALNADDLVIDKGASESGITLISTAAASIRFGDAANTSIGSVEYNHNSNYMRFSTNGSERLRIDSSGNVGIGTTSPNVRTEIKANVNGNPVTSGLTQTNGALRVRGAATNVLDIGQQSAAPYGMWMQVCEATSLGVSYPLLLNPNGGNVGIGVSSPVGTLSVSTTTAGENVFRAEGVAGRLFIDHAGAGNNLYDAANHKFRDFAGNEHMRLDSSGNLGLGTTSPAEKLEISDTQASGGVELLLTNIGDGGTSTTPYTAIRSRLNSIRNGGEIRFGRDSNYGSADNADSNIQFYTALNDTNTERMRIDSSGNVGIGTTSVASGGANTQNVQIHNSTANSTYLKLSTSGTGATASDGLDLIMGNDGTGYLWNRENSSVIFATNNTERLRITSAGNVGIGTTSPANLFSVSASSTVTTRYTSSDTGAFSLLEFENSGSIVFSADHGNTQSNSNIIFKSDGASERMRITSDGTLLIGCTSEGNTNAYFSLESNDRSVLALGTSTTSTSTVAVFRNPNGGVGSVSVSGSATAYNTSSDYRLKEDLQDFNGLDKVSKIPVYDFKWKTDGSRSYGVMAHELQEVLPQAVSGEKDAEEMQQVDYSKLVPILLKSIQELESRVQELEKEI